MNKAAHILFFIRYSLFFIQMRTLIQRVNEAKVTVDQETVGEIGKGLLIFLGITHADTEKEADYLVNKIANLRLFPKESHFDQSPLEIKGEVLVVSQFTLYGSTKKGRRPDFNDSAPQNISKPLYEYFVKKMSETGLKTATGQFGAEMKVSLVNNGPATFLLES